MAAVIRIDPKAATATIVATGVVSGPEFCRTLEALYADARFKPGMGELWDLRLAHADVSAEDVQAIVAMGQRGTGIRGTGRTAIVAPQDFEFGMARLLQVHAEPLPVEVQVFKAYEQAVEWLSDLSGPRVVQA